MTDDRRESVTVSIAGSTRLTDIPSQGVGKICSDLFSKPEVIVS